MIPVSNNYKSYLLNKSFSPYSKIIVDGVEYLGNVIKTFPKIKHQASTIAGSFPSKVLDFEMYDFNNNIDFQGKELEVYKGFLINGTVEYIKQGVFIPKAENITRNISAKVISFKNVQDRVQLLENKYESSLNYSGGQTHTGLEIVQEICAKRNINLVTLNFAFSNYSFPQPNFPENITEREVVSRLSEIGGETTFFDYNGNLCIKSQTNTNVTIQRSQYEKISEEKVITFNTVVLGKKGIDDDIIYPLGINDSDRVEFKILDNPFVDLIRESIIAEVAQHIIGLTYMPYELIGFIDGFIYELNDVVSILDRNGSVVRAVILDYESTSRYKSDIKIDLRAEFQKTNYSLAGSDQMELSKVRLEVDHINKKVESTVEDISEQNTKISKITQTVDEINSKISDIADITISGESNFASFELDNINKSEPIMVRIRPTVRNISYIYPSPNLYPNENLFSPSRKIRFHNKDTNEDFDYELPDDLLFYDNDTYDEFYLNYDSQTCQVIKRCRYNANGEVVALGSEVTTDYPYPSIELTDGDYVISLPSYEYGYLFARLMVQNIYTTQFATKAEVSSQISQTTQSINLSVDQKLTNYSTTTQMNSAISLKANEITSSVSETYATKATTNQLSSRISQSAKSIELITDDNGTSAGITIRLKNEDGTQIDEESGNITMNGLVSFNDLSSAGSTTINGSNITTGKINADLIKAGTLNGNNVTITNLNASNIKSGTLTSRAINNGNGTFSVSSNGTIYAKSGTIGGWNLSSSKLYGTSSSTQYAISPSGIEDETHSRSIGWSQLISSSDERLKNNIKDIEDKYNQFYDDLKPVSFKFNEGIDNGNLHFGFIAQDVLKSEKLVNENLSMIEETDKYYNLYKQEIIALNTWQIQMLKEEVRLLKEEINKLKEKK